MTDLNPYEVLGLRPQDATKAAVNRAFKDKLSAAHPDHEGGSAEDMVRLNQARDILLNPERRRRFDETGSTETGQLTVEEQVVEIIGNLFAVVLEKGSQLSKAKICAAVATEIHKGLNIAKESQRKHPERIRRMRGMLDSVDGDPLLRQALARRLATFERQALEINQQVVVGERMLEVMKSLKFI